MIFEKIKELLLDFGDFKEEDLQLETTFENLGLDSLDVVDLIMKLDEEFGTTIQMNASLKTIGNLVDYIENEKK